ncbi:response regulator [Herbaspirillum sp. RTI4]|uniref:response regulator n=1 Tax=Herbaspirillum sp. RTI4 TaxID=3048640 RepID=UPI002AB3531B|nr:response regulator [Herbaspirillum sp. RTI4]MDY7579166.1 response regulator [Herbaspirillum sp. RTI4]MEA9981255.1 response regulator [Herbaspirillum sp. RTI4]
MKRILIVDDAATVRLFHRTILEEGGYFVDEAINGIEALEKALVNPYDLYLVDVNMPKLDGYAFVRELRSHPMLPQAPAVMVSTEAKTSDQNKAWEAGANLYIIKPAKPEVLLRHVRLLLGEVGI